MREEKATCPCCGQKILIQINESTGEISCVSFYVDEESNFKNIELGI